MKGLSQFLLSLALPVVGLVSWEIWATLNAGSTLVIVLPPPTQIASEGITMLTESDFWIAAARTFGLTTLGFGLGSMIAVTLGMTMGRSVTVTKLVAPSLLAFRSLPIVLYVPVTLVLLNSGPKIPVSLAALVTILYSAPPVAQAVSALDDEKRLFLQARGTKGLSFYLNFVVPEVISALYQSLSIAVTLSLAVTVVAEILLPNLGGFGSSILQARDLNQYTRLWALTLLLALAGLLFHSIVIALWRTAAPWLSQKRV
jgi:ABC-type nitrate/sulfonate/bicarbonate transport system permease component